MNPQANDDLARARLPLPEIIHQAYNKLDLSPQSGSQRKDYFLQVEVEGEVQVQIFPPPANS